MKGLHMVAFVVLIIGGLNWLLVAFDYNLVDAIFGVGSMGAKTVYILVGLAAISEAVTHKQNCRRCTSDAPAGGMA